VDSGNITHMKILMLQAIFDTCGSRDLIPLECCNCHKTYYKNKNEVQRQIANKLSCRVSDYCSKQCKPNAAKLVTCAQCGKTRYKLQKEIKRTKLNFCNKSCSAKYRNSHLTTKQIKTKNMNISLALKNRYENDGIPRFRYKNGQVVKIVNKICIICLNPFKTHCRKSTCSSACYKLLQSKVLKGKTGGPRKGGGWGKHSDYTKKDGTIIHCQSTMEYNFCKIAEQLNLSYSRNLKGFPYTTLDGKSRNYYPDFILNNIFVELKGYITKEAEYKMKTAKVPNLVIIKTKKYGGNWEEIVKEPNLLIKQLQASEASRTPIKALEEPHSTIELHLHKNVS
jgi:hypothetical protein